MKKNNQEESRRWLTQAEYDLKAAEWNQKGELYAHACFMSQQAAEKCLKAFLYSNGARIVFGHSVVELMSQCKKFNKKFSEYLESARLLDRYYIPTRYPNGLPGGVPSQIYSKADAGETISAAEDIIKFVNKSMDL